ncbi:MAG: peptide MFS transporter [Gammaproteobacteria bacterium]|nr:peptide MFS transporter [Gammaproteobacteria bacterium]
MPSPSLAASDTAFFGHPRALGTLFFTELWERFSYYGMRAILILFMTAPLDAGGLGFDVGSAGAIYGLYTGMVYLACLPGGWLADRLLGARHATLAGGVVIMLGHICLALPFIDSFYAGLVCIVIGTGLLKPNVSTLVGHLYGAEDRRRDAGFSIYYMGINSGAFLAPLVCGALAQGEGFRALLARHGIEPALAWHFGFGAAALGMALGLVSYWRGSAHFGDAGLPPPPSMLRVEAARRTWRGATVLLLAAALAAWLVLSGQLTLSAAALANVFGLLLLAITVAFFVWIFSRGDWTAEERRRLWLVLALFLGATAFWSLYEQGGSTLNLFAERNTDTRLFGYDFPASWMQSLNPIYIICGLAPAFAWLWPKLGRHEPSSPAKFAIGLAFMALGYGVMIGAGSIAQSGVKVSPSWLALMYFLHTIGEMCLSPVGLSAMTRLAPARIASLTMGVWFLASSIGSYLGGRVAGLYDSLGLAQIFGALTVFAMLAALVMALLVKPLRRMLIQSAEC